MASQRTDTTRAVRGEIKERLRPIGVIRSDLKDCAHAPTRGPEGAPDAWVDMYGLFVEGLVAKRRNGAYEPGLRTGAWMKMRVNRGQEFVIGGYTHGTRTFDALIFGYYRGTS